MKKIEYQTPELEVITLKAPVVLQAASDGTNNPVVPPTEPSDEPTLD